MSVTLPIQKRGGCARTAAMALFGLVAGAQALPVPDRIPTAVEWERSVSAIFKQEAHKLIDQLPESAGWDDLVYQAALHASIERGKADVAAGRMVPVEDLMREFGLAE